MSRLINPDSKLMNELKALEQKSSGFTLRGCPCFILDAETLKIEAANERARFCFGEKISSHAWKLFSPLVFCGAHRQASAKANYAGCGEGGGLEPPFGDGRPSEAVLIRAIASRPKARARLVWAVETKEHLRVRGRFARHEAADYIRALVDFQSSIHSVDDLNGLLKMAAATLSGFYQDGAAFATMFDQNSGQPRQAFGRHGQVEHGPEDEVDFFRAHLSALASGDDEKRAGESSTFDLQAPYRRGAISQAGASFIISPMSIDSHKVGAIMIAATEFDAFGGADLEFVRAITLFAERAARLSFSAIKKPSSQSRGLSLRNHATFSSLPSLKKSGAWTGLNGENQASQLSFDDGISKAFHKFNNAMAIIISGAQLMRMAEPPEEVRRDINSIEEAANQSITAISGLRGLLQDFKKSSPL